jgi:hypothetical protein
MNDSLLIWEAYQNSISNIVYHVSRKKFDDIYDWSHFTKNIHAAKDIINTDKSEGKYVEGSTYYVYKYKMNPDLKLMRSVDIHSEHVPQWGNSGRSNDWSKHIQGMFYLQQTEDTQFRTYVTNAVLNELKSRYDNNPERKKLFELILNFLNKNPKYIKIPESQGMDSHKAWKPVHNYFIKILDPNKTKSTRELMNLYSTMATIIDSLQMILIRNISQNDYDNVKLWKVWIFESDDDNIHGNFFYENQINKKSFINNLITSYYDGVVYNNEVEGGGDSYILFHPKRDLQLISREILQNSEN